MECWVVKIPSVYGLGFKIYQIFALDPRVCGLLLLFSRGTMTLNGDLAKAAANARRSTWGSGLMLRLYWDNGKENGNY